MFIIIFIKNTIQELQFYYNIILKKLLILNKKYSIKIKKKMNNIYK